MVSSHILPELADVCNKIGIIERGELLVNDDVATVMQKVRGQMVLRIAVRDNLDRAAVLLEQHGTVEKIDHVDSHLRVTLIPGDHDPSELAKLLVHNGHALTQLSEEEINLETAFMALTKGITS
jgi:ABC-2 type transport system ATP-binding protein